MTPEGDLLVGETAARRGLLEPHRLLREFTRDVGDDVPLFVAGRRLAPEQVLAATVRSVVDDVTRDEGLDPSGVTVTHPIAWGSHRIGRLTAALADAGLGRVSLVSEPEAAVRQGVATQTLGAARTVAVFDLGGVTFDAAVIRTSTDGTASVLGRPVGLDDVGGALFDDAVFTHVVTSAAADAQPGRDDRVVLMQLRRECVEAKEALSFDPDVAIPVHSSAGATSVRLTRSEFENMVEAHLDRTFDVLDDAVAGAGIGMDEVEAILLVGGSSRIPRVAQRLSELFDRAIVVEADPQSTIACGAARTALALLEESAAITQRSLPLPAASATDLVPDDDVPSHGELVLAGFPAPATPAPTKRVRVMSWWVGAVAAALVAGGAVGFSLSGGLSEADDARDTAALMHAPDAGLVDRSASGIGPTPEGRPLAQVGAAVSAPGEQRSAAQPAGVQPVTPWRVPDGRSGSERPGPRPSVMLVPTPGSSPTRPQAQPRSSQASTPAQSSTTPRPAAAQPSTAQTSPAQTSTGTTTPAQTSAPEPPTPATTQDVAQTPEPTPTPPYQPEPSPTDEPAPPPSQETTSEPALVQP